MKRIASNPKDFPQSSNVNGFRRIAKSKFILDHQGVIAKFSELNHESKMAIAFYMGIDGEAWDFDLIIPGFYEMDLPKIDDSSPEARLESFKNLMLAYVKKIESHMEEIVTAKGDSEYGHMVVPVKHMIKEWKKIDSDGKHDFGGIFKKYHEWYQSASKYRTPMPSTWPVILSSFDDELLEDGWNRFHSYVASGAELIEVLWYPAGGVIQHD